MAGADGQNNASNAKSIGTWNGTAGTAASSVGAGWNTSNPGDAAAFAPNAPKCEGNISLSRGCLVSPSNLRHSQESPSHRLIYRSLANALQPREEFPVSAMLTVRLTSTVTVTVMPSSTASPEVESSSSSTHSAGEQASMSVATLGKSSSSSSSSDAPAAKTSASVSSDSTTSSVLAVSRDSTEGSGLTASGDSTTSSSSTSSSVSASTESLCWDDDKLALLPCFSATTRTSTMAVGITTTVTSTSTDGSSNLCWDDELAALLPCPASTPRRQQPNVDGGDDQDTDVEEGAGTPVHGGAVTMYACICGALVSTGLALARSLILVSEWE
ncbi:MAG: hypothetical protein M1815_003363 [Lichina confinis]|nr:MAG: hypothetical protein M1815_003363 [Lichina confinis]